MLKGKIERHDRVEILTSGQFRGREGFVQAAGMMAWVDLDLCLSGKEKSVRNLPFAFSDLKLKGKFISKETDTELHEDL